MTNQGQSLRGQISGGADGRGQGDKEQARILDPPLCLLPGKTGVTVPTPSAALRLGWNSRVKALASTEYTLHFNLLPSSGAADAIFFSFSFFWVGRGEVKIAYPTSLHPNAGPSK